MRVRRIMPYSRKELLNFKSRVTPLPNHSRLPRAAFLGMKGPEPAQYNQGLLFHQFE